MIRISSHNRARALEVLVSAFKAVPGALWVIKKSGDQEKRLKVLCRHCLKVSIQKNGAYISSDNKGVALIFKSTAGVDLFHWLIWYLQLGTYCIGWERALSMIRREYRIVSRRPKQPHLYFWMIAVEDQSNGINTIVEIRDFAFALSKQLKLPIVAETTLKSNLVLFQRYGFQLYDEWDTKQNDLKVWFLRREWDA